jgi:uncharacterized protein YukE
MADKFSVNPESLLGASARFSLASAELDSALGRLQHSLGALGDVCGGDDQGRAFGSGYKPSAAKLEQAFASMVKGLAGIGDAFDAMALNYLGGDSASQVQKGG